jgi:hypothetical protein
MQRRCAAKTLHLLDRKVADPDRADRSPPEQRVHRLRGFLDRNQRVGPVNLIDVDMIGSKPAQGILDLLQDAGPAGIAEDASVLPIKPGLGGDEHLRAQAAPGDRLADDFLRAAKPVDRRRIDEVDAMLQRRPDRGHGPCFIGAAPHPTADGPRAERDTRHLERRTPNVGKLQGRLRGVDFESFGLAGHDLAPFSRVSRVPCWPGDRPVATRSH